MKFIDGDHPFFRPIWRRVLVVAVCLGWAAVEWLTGAPGWATIFAGVGLYALYEFFLKRTEQMPEDKQE